MVSKINNPELIQEYRKTNFYCEMCAKYEGKYPVSKIELHHIYGNNNKTDELFIFIRCNQLNCSHEKIHLPLSFCAFIFNFSECTSTNAGSYFGRFANTNTLRNFSRHLDKRIKKL